MSPLSAKKSSKLSLKTKFLSGVENFEYAVSCTVKKWKLNLAYLKNSKRYPKKVKQFWVHGGINCSSKFHTAKRRKSKKCHISVKKKDIEKIPMVLKLNIWGQKQQSKIIPICLGFPWDILT